MEMKCLFVREMRNKFLELERYFGTMTNGTHWFYDFTKGDAATKPIKDFVRWCLVVALNSSQRRDPSSRDGQCS